MKRVLTIILLLVFLALLWQLYQLFIQSRELEKTSQNLSLKTEGIKKENAELQADLEYFKEPENLGKELRGSFNYKKPGEKLIIIVPPENNQ